MRTGKAAVLVKPNKLETWDVPVPDPAEGGLLVSMIMGGVCGSDVHIAVGEYGEMPFPVILGHEGLGRIEKLGKGVEKDYVGTPISTGDLVYWCPIALCHRCYSCTVLEAVPCENTAFFEDATKPNWGCYAEYAWLPNGMAFYRVPEGASLDAIAALGCALPSTIGGLERAGDIRVGQSVVVQGAGPVGLSGVLLAALAGARHLIAIDSSEKRLEIARQLGATATVSLNTSPDERRRQIYDLVGPQGPDLVLEAAGKLPAFSEGLSLVGAHGRYLQMGILGEMGSHSIKPGDLSSKNTTVFGYTFSKPKHYYRALQLAVQMQDRFPLASLITHRFGIGKAAEALEVVQSGAAIKAVIDPSITC